MVIDFSLFWETSFAGRSNGRDHWISRSMIIDDPQMGGTVIIKASLDQTITSEYFEGLLGEVFSRHRTHGSAMRGIEHSCLSVISQDSLLHAMERHFDER